jgi:hypothetical protein
MKDTQMQESLDGTDIKSTSSSEPDSGTAVSGPRALLQAAAQLEESTNDYNTSSSRKRKMDCTNDEAPGEAAMEVMATGVKLTPKQKAVST